MHEQMTHVIKTNRVYILYKTKDNQIPKEKKEKSPEKSKKKKCQTWFRFSSALTETHQ